MIPFVTREEAGLRPPLSVSHNIAPEGLTAHYGGRSPWGDADRSTPGAFRDSTDHNRCASIWRAWQAYHMDSNALAPGGAADIAYSSGVCPHGVRYEGRGPEVRTAANGTNYSNLVSYATVYIAGGDDPLTDEAKAAYLAEQDRLAALRWDHSDWYATSCAGDPIREWEAQGWPAPAAIPDPLIPPPVLPPTAPQPPPGPRLLYYGAAGPDVADLQTWLNGNGFPCGRVDGIFGKHTVGAVRAFQTVAGIGVDGVVGAQTRAAMAVYLPPVAAPPTPPSVPVRNPHVPLQEDGIFGPKTIRALQWVIGETQDGDWGPSSRRSLQYHLGVNPDSWVGPETIRALQTRIGAPHVDGLWGPETTTYLQRALNQGVF